LYCYPESIDDALIQAMARNSKVCHYIDMPIQHASDWILGRMGRKTSQKDIKVTIEKLRAAMPDIAIRTSLISGFPGETETMHKEMIDFLKEMDLDRVGCFPYSREKGTPSYSYPNQHEEKIKNRWRDEIMSTQQGLVFRKNRALIGKTFPVMVEGFMSDQGVYVGRTYRDAPSVDGLVFFPCERELISGDILPVRITAVTDYDLVGELNNEFTE
jgi:ribosomal protein S12 methylthiotransferase